MSFGLIVDRGNHQAIWTVGGVALLLFSLYFIVTVNMRMQDVEDLSQIWAFYFDWGFSIITGGVLVKT